MVVHRKGRDFASTGSDSNTEGLGSGSGPQRLYRDTENDSINVFNEKVNNMEVMLPLTLISVI